MANNGRKLVIGVFGGSDDDEVNAYAVTIGAKIAMREQILLTGGTGPGTGAVKDCAILGVGNGYWIGVDPNGAAPGTSVKGNGFVIHTGLSHKRNYLEACLCDAAIGLKGGNGTVSEVTFSLAEKRPVAFVGDHWRPNFDLDSPTRNQILDKMVRMAFDRVGRTPSEIRTLDANLNENVVKSKLRALPAYRYFPSNAAPGSIIDWILNTILSRDLAIREFPAVEGFEAVAICYRNWVGQVAAR